MRRPAVVLTLIAVALASVSATARADFGPPTLLSGTSKLQFGEANAPALASEGRYAVFQGTLAGISGVYRRDLESGAVEPVAVEEPSDAAISAPDASAPSVSANGQYVAFTTTADLDPEHSSAQGGAPEGEPAADEGCPEVYVRNMDLPASTPGAYTLASALNGSGEGITFAGGCTAETKPFEIAGAQAAPGVALSANGQSVVFTVLSSSNLGTGPGGEATTPASQVAVRDIETDTTTLVTATPAGAPTPGGGAYPSAQAELHLHGSTTAETLIGQELTGSTAAISADGSTVAWLGTDVPAQVPGSGPEIEAGTYHESGSEAAPSEVEPLWRRIADGPGGSTRRLLAGAGLDLFYSPAQPGEIVTAGSLVGTVALPLFIPPALSANGEVVALISNAPRPAAVRSAELDEGKVPTTDAYTVHVEDDPAVPVQVTPLTETPDYDATPQALGYVDDIAISPSGSRVAFDAQRTQFTLPALALVSPPVSYTGDGETYEANLALGTLQRVSATFDGLQPTGAAGLLAFSADERQLAFASQATNLFYGDAVKGSEVYETEEFSNAIPPAPEQLGSAPEEPLPNAESLLDATAFSLSNGSVQVYARTPGAGTLTVTASAQLSASALGDARRASRSRRVKHKAHRSADAHGAGLMTRTVAYNAGRVGASGELHLIVSAGVVYRALVDDPRGLYAVLHVSFAAPGSRRLTEEIPVTFRRTLRTKLARKKGTPANGAHSGRLRSRGRRKTS